MTPPTAAAHPEHPARLIFQYMPAEGPSIAYVESRGTRCTEHVYHVARDLHAPISATPPPAGLEVRRWRMESAAEQQDYVTALNEAFPGAPTALADWQHFMQSPRSAGYTEYIFVRPAWRRRGLARA